MKSTRTKKKRIKRLFIILIIVVAVACCVMICLLTIPKFRVLRKLRKAEKCVAVWDYDRAIETYAEALSISKKHPEVYDGLRRAYILKGDSIYEKDYDLAMEYYSNALSVTRSGLTDTGDDSFSYYIADVEKMMLEKHKHDSGTFIDVKQPTCSEEGIRELRCNSCGEVLKCIPIEKLPHTPGEWEEETAADCTHTGLRVKRCTVCGAIAESEEISMLPHEPGEWETERESDCSPGIKVRRCVHCGEVVESEEIPATKVHIKGSWETVKEPDCENAGEKILKCKRCEDIIATEEIPPNGHKKNTKGERYEDTDVLIYKCGVCGIVLEPESIAHVMYMDSLPQTADDGLFSDISAEYDEKGKFVISFSLNQETELSDFGYILLNNTDLSSGVLVTFDECRNKVRTTTSNPRSLNESVNQCSITDTSGEISSQLKASTVYYYRVFYISDEWIYLSDFRRFVTKTE